MKLHRRLAAGFTLIEVLIGVLVLALGLLGLGAVIPVVVREQRLASDATLGIEVMSSAKSYLKGRRDLDPTRPFTYTTPGVPDVTVGWDKWILDPNWSPTFATDPSASYLWEPTRTAGTNQEFDLNTGEFYWEETGTPSFYATISLADRLWPSESAQSHASLRPGLDPARPQFVWDFVGRRLETAAGEPEQLQVAIFVRRIDQSIRVPRATWGTPAQPVTLRDVLLGRRLPAATDAALPVAAYGGTGPQAYIPTNTGTIPGASPRYSVILTLDQSSAAVTPEFDPRWPNRIDLRGLPLTDNRWKLVSRPGQKIVDNLGNVYTVRGIPSVLEPQDPGRSTQIIVDPPVPASVPSFNATRPNGTNSGRLRQIIFTPQVPAAVEVFTITRTPR